MPRAIDHGRGLGVPGDGDPQRLAHALGHAGGARGVEHLAALGLVVEGLGTAGGQDAGPGREPRHLAAGGDPERDRAEVQRCGHPGQPGGDHQGPGAAVVQDVLGLVPAQVGVERRVVEPGPLGGPRRLEELRAVHHHQGHVVAGLQAGPSEGVGEPVGPLVELAVGGHLARAGQDHRRTVGMVGGLGAEVGCGCHGVGLHGGRIVGRPTRTDPGCGPLADRATRAPAGSVT